MKSFVIRGTLAGALVGIALVAGTIGAAAQDEIAAAGNGGTSDGSANGGAVALGTISSGGNVGSAIVAGDTWGDVAVGGGSVANATDGTVAIDGGVGIADASSGDYNIAFIPDGDGDDD